jgi:hypothetical protein
MLYFVILFSIFIFLLGAYLGVIAYRQHDDILYSSTPVTIGHILKIAAFYGVSAGLFFTLIVLLLGIATEPEYNWTVNGIMWLFVISIMLVIIVFIGSIYQISISVKFKGTFIKKF